MSKRRHKLKIAVIFGGRSGEHEVSLVSARSVMKSLNPKKYQIIPVLIDKKGRGFEKIVARRKKIDAVFPLIHGTFGEDGTLQGFLDICGLPYVGAGVTGSAVGMDKVIQKHILLSIGLLTPPFYWFRKMDWQKKASHILRHIREGKNFWGSKEKLKFPFFVKPANLGSSLGISKAHSFKELAPAIREAFRYDEKILVEMAVPLAREIECAVLGNDEPVASVCGEVIPSNEFYDYDAKYVDGQSRLKVPAKLPAGIHRCIQEMAKKAFIALDCSGMARADFLLSRKTGKAYFNEINTIPGFTAISMYPKLWEASGLKYSKLLDKLIELALERHFKRQKLLLSYQPKKKWW